VTNTLANSTLVTKKSLAILVNMLKFTKFVNRDFEGDFGNNNGFMSGQTIQIRKPPRYNIRAGKVAVPQATVETTIPLTLAQAGVDVKFSSLDYTLNLSDLETKLQAAMEVIANKIDLDGLTLAAASAPNYVAIAGAPTPTSTQALSSILSVGQKLDENGAPRGSARALILGPLGNTELMPGLQGFFNNQATLGEQYNDGVVADSLGFKFGMDQNVVTLTNGTQPSSGGTVNGASQTGSTLNVNTGSITGTITAGSKFTIAGVFAVNPQNRQSTGSLQQFTVTTAAAAGATSLLISPAITPTGQFQNVTASPANTAAITFYGTASTGFQANIGFHRDAFTLACVPMATFGKSGVVEIKTETYKGISLRMVKFYDGVNDDLITRFDVLYGWAAPYPELSCVLAG
jgi:hypothetical protein